jgi:hypothetical protein
MTTKGRRGFKFTTQEIKSLLDVIEKIVPIGNPDWGRVWDRQMACYPKKEWTAKSLRCKFQELVKKNSQQLIQIVCLTFILLSAFTV